MGNNNKVTDNNKVDDKVSFMSVNKQSNENGDIGNALELGRKKALHLQLTAALSKKTFSSNGWEG